MEKYTCPVCHKTTYTANRETADICPYCSTEKMLILNQKMLSSINDFSDTRLLLDRRNSAVRPDTERRGESNIELIPIAWLVIKKKSSQKDAT